MPTYEQVETTIGSQFNASWGFTPVLYENVADKDALGKGVADYISIKVMYNASAAAEIGVGAIRRTWGNLLVDFHTKENKGTQANQVNMDRLAAIFEYQVISDIVFRDITVLRSSDFQGWYITPAMVRFYFNR